MRKVLFISLICITLNTHAAPFIGLGVGFTISRFENDTDITSEPPLGDSNPYGKLKLGYRFHSVVDTSIYVEHISNIETDQGLNALWFETDYEF